MQDYTDLMWNYIEIIIRFAAILSGALFLYVAAFTYEDEQRKLQDVLIKWWDRIDNYEKSWIPRHTAFMREVARITSKGFDKLFGRRFISFQSIGVSASLSMASFWFIASLESITGFFGQLVDSQKNFFSDLNLFTILLLLSVYLILGIMPLFIEKQVWLDIWFRIVVLVTIVVSMVIPIYTVLKLSDYSARIVFNFDNIFVLPSWSYLVGLIVGVTSDILFIALTRRVIRWSAGLESFIKILAIITLNCISAFLLFVWPVAFAMWYFNSLQPSPSLASAIVFGLLMYVSFFASAFNSISVLVAVIFILLALLMLLHKVFWPLLSRPIYALEKLGITGRNKLLVTMGLPLIGYGTGVLPAWLEKLFETFVK